MKIKDVLKKEVYSVSPDTALISVADMMRDYGIGAIPVCEEGRPVGIVTDRDIVISCATAMSGCISECKVKDFMTKYPKTISPDRDLEQAAELMAASQIRRLPVVEEGKLVGMLSLADIALALKENHRLLAETLVKISTPT